MKNLLSSIFAILLFTFPIYAQEGDLDQRTEDLMREIQERMRSIEQSLARASLEPDDLISLFEQLQRMQQDGNLENLPPSLAEFLYQNSDWVSELASENDLELTEDRIRELLEQDNTGSDLLNEFPDLFDKLLDDPEKMEDFINEYQQAENDLERLFRDTESNMQQAENDLERLLEMAQAMQEQMNQQAASERESLEQPENQEQQEEFTEGNEGEDGASSPSDENDSVDGDTDPDAWDVPGLPQRELENFRDANPGDRPQGYEAESDAYLRELARAWRRYFEQLEKEEEKD